jgi:hypothetical protein
MGVIGVEFLYAVIRNSKALQSTGRRVLSIATSVLLMASVIAVAYITVIDHPNEYVYFNRFAGSDMTEIMTQYEVDYFGVAYRQALEYIAANDPSPLIKIVKTQTGVEKNAELLKIEDRRRITFCAANEDPDYLIIPGADLPPDYTGATLYYSINVANGRIVSVYRLK